MSLLDTIKDTVTKLVPRKEDPLPKPGMGSLVHEEDVCIHLFIHIFYINDNPIDDCLQTRHRVPC